MKRLAATLCLAVSLAATSLGETTPEGEDPISRYLYPPDKVIGHSQQIGLDEAQRTGVRNEVHKAQEKFLDLQFELQGEGEKLGRLLQEKPVDETKVLAQVDRVLALEKDVKRTQISLLVRIKNLLTPAQQTRLTEILRSDSK
jgi:Spy/CpxP family protein refolding chaperone